MWSLSLVFACGESGHSDLASPLTERPPASSPLEALKGRWDPVVIKETGPVRETGCPGPESFVELRGDGDGGWEMVAQISGELQILPVISAKQGPGGLSLELGAPTPDQPATSASLTWVEEGRLATFGAPLQGQTYVAPSKRESVPEIPCGG